MAIKAGHNAENHNQNDIGSFILHVDGETFLTDPGRGLYTRQYFGPERYDNIFANSYGHSVPRIGGQLQKEGREFSGEIVSVETGGPVRRVEIEFARAYPVTNLVSARRLVTLDPNGGLELSDIFRFSENPVEVEEALITWLQVEVNGATAVIHGERRDLRLTIESPVGAHLYVERLDEPCRVNLKPHMLTRLAFTLPIAAEARARVRIKIS
jgi:hypothetical protein